VAFGEAIKVEEEFVGGAFRVAVSDVNGVLFASFRASEILETAKSVRDGEVGLLDAGKHFLVELFLEGFGWFEDGVGVCVFGVEVGEDFRIFFFTEPSVIVHARSPCGTISTGRFWLRRSGLRGGRLPSGRAGLEPSWSMLMRF